MCMNWKIRPVKGQEGNAYCVLSPKRMYRGRHGCTEEWCPANSQKKSPFKSPGSSQDAQFHVGVENPGEDELEEEDQEDEQEGDNTDEQDIEEEEIEEQYYDDVYFRADIDSLAEDFPGEEEEDSE